MTNWKIKADENIKCAEILINGRKFSSSVHCSYYSNIQLLLHVLHEEFNKTEDQIDEESKKDENGFHIWLKNYITRELTTRQFMILRDFNNYFGKLKKIRIKADYKNIIISENKAKEAQDASLLIKRIIEENFRL